MNIRGHHRFRVTAPPLTEMEQLALGKLPGAEAFTRIRALGIGTHYVTTREAQYLTVSGGVSTIVEIAHKLMDWQRKTYLFPEVYTTPYGTIGRQELHVHVSDLTDLSQLRKKYPDVQVTNTVLAQFLTAFKTVMLKRANIDWNPGGKERRQATEIIRQVGGLEAALDCIKDYYMMAPEQRGDILSFAGFRNALPRIFAQREMYSRERMKNKAIERRLETAAQRPTDEEQEEFLKKADAQIAENRANQRPRRKSRWAEDD